MITKPHTNPKLLDNPRYEPIRNNLTSLHAQITGLAGQLYAGKQVPAEIGIEIAKEIIPDLENLLIEARRIASGGVQPSVTEQ